MAAEFNAKQEAASVEQLGYNLLHGSFYDFSQYQDHLAHLNKDQVDELKSQLKWDSWKPNTLPTVDMQTDKDGHITALSFYPSFWDKDPQGVSVHIGVGEKKD